MYKFPVLDLSAHGDTVCPGSSNPFYIISCYIKWVTTSWTHSNYAGACSSTGSKPDGGEVKFKKLKLSHKTKSQVRFCDIILYTVCPRSSDPFLYSKVLYKMSHYFLDTQYVQNIGSAFPTIIIYRYLVIQFDTMCQGSSDPFYIASILYIMGHYFLDILYCRSFWLGLRLFVSSKKCI